MLPQQATFQYESILWTNCDNKGQTDEQPVNELRAHYSGSDALRLVVSLLR